MVKEVKNTLPPNLPDIVSPPPLAKVILCPFLVAVKEK